MTPPVDMQTGVKASWCDNAWCYIDPCACDDANANQAFYFDAELFYSYATCGTADQWTQSVMNTVPGHETKCGSEETDGGHQATIIPGTILLVLVMLQQYLTEKR